MPIHLDEAILRSKTGTHIINVLLSVDVLLKLYKEGKVPSQDRIDRLDKRIREIEAKRIKAVTKKNSFYYVRKSKESTW